MTPTPQALGHQVRAMRTKRNLSQRELGALVGVTGPHIANIEAGRKLTMPMLFKISAALGYQLTMFFDELD